MSRRSGFGLSLGVLGLVVGCNQADRTDRPAGTKETIPSAAASESPVDPQAAQKLEDEPPQGPMIGTTASGQQIMMTDTTVQPVDTIDASPTPPEPAKRPPAPAPAKPAPKPGAAANPRPAPAPVAHAISPTPEPTDATASNRAPEPEFKGPHWACASPTYEFGEVWSGAQVSWTFEYRNDGTETLKILEAKPTCHCTALKNFTRSLEPGEIGKITLVVNTSGQAGNQSKVIKVQTSDPTQESVSLTMKGFVKTLFSTNPPMGAAFGMVKGDEPLERVVTLSNNTDQPVTMTMLPSTGSKAFTAALQETVPGKEFKVTVKATPPLDLGSNSANFRFQTNHPMVPEYTMTANAYVQPRIQVNPPKLVVENAPQKDSDWTVRIFNNGPNPLDLQSIRTTDPRLKPRLVDVAPGQKHKYELKITVPQAWVPPPYAETIEITTNDQEYGKIEIPVQPSFRLPSARPSNLADSWVMVDMRTGDPVVAATDGGANTQPSQAGVPDHAHAMKPTAKPGE